MKRLQFNTQNTDDYEIGGAVITLNPTDAKFAARLVSAFDGLDALEAQMQDALNKDDGAVAELERIDREMRAVINKMFAGIQYTPQGSNIADLICGGVSLYAISDGLPVWTNLLLALMDEVDEAITSQQAASDPRVEAYLKKYDKRHGGSK